MNAVIDAMVPAPVPAPVPTPSPSPSPPMGLLRRRAFLLGSANAFDYAMQFLLPVVFARTLSAEVFGQYRLLWLILMTVLTIAPLAMPQTLYFFLPRADAVERRLYVHQTWLYLTVAGVLGGLLIAAWTHFQADRFSGFAPYGLLIPSLLLLLSSSSLLDLLPTIEERIRWQATLTLSLSLLRALALAAAAWLAGDLLTLIWVLIGFALVKLLLLLGYVAVNQGLAGPWISRRSFVEQFRHAAPFGLSGALCGLRGQADQWVAASLFSLHSFAAFSISAVIGPLVNLFRLSVNHVFLPSMSRRQAAGDLPGMIDLNSRANVMVAALVYPLLAYAFAFAEDLVSLVYTDAYLEAAPVMRVYIVGLTALVVELASITLLLKEGVFALRLNSLVLVASVVVSGLAAVRYGLAGAAAGSVFVIFIDRLATLIRIRKRTAMPLGQLQDWRSLGWLLLFSALAALLAWGITGRYLSEAMPFLKLLMAGAILAAAYAALNALHGVGRGGMFAVFSPER